MASEVQFCNGPTYKDIDGFRVNKYFRTELYRSALKYQPQPGDVFVVTYPKCGTTWVQHIGYLILHKGAPPPSGLDFYRCNPFFEMFGAEAVEEMTRPGLIKTHLPYHLLPQHPQAKYIYVCRNPKDACVSYFYHTRGFSGYEFEDGRFEDYFDIYVEGENDFGDYFDHVLSWYAHRDDPNVLFINYEDMKRDPRKYVLKIAKFINSDCYNMLQRNEQILQDVLKYSDIKSMRQYGAENFRTFFATPLKENNIPFGLKAYHEMAQRYPKKAGFIRKGIVGDCMQHLTPEMHSRMEDKILRKLSQTDLIDLWRKHDIM
ncbi:unnamed protein product [Ixodes hexagonus]